MMNKILRIILFVEIVALNRFLSPAEIGMFFTEKGSNSYHMVRN